MKTNQKHKYRWALLSFLLLVLILGGAVYYHIATKPQKATYSTSGDASQKGSTKKGNSVTSSSGNSSTATTGTPSADNSSIAITPVQTPAADAPYPIQNEHYRINQTGTTQFDITLFAINNSPSQYNDYVTQLKQYKAEVLDYLTARYGSTSKLILNWSPPDAKDL